MATIEADAPGVDQDEQERFGDEPAPRGKLLRPINDTVDPETGERMIDWPGHRKVAKEAVKLWESQDKPLEREIAQWRINAARRRGVMNAKLQFDNIDERWIAWFPHGASPDTIPEGNKAATLCRRLKALLFTDPPAPIVEPTGDDDENEDAAEVTTRALADLQSEANLNTPKKLEDAFDFASDYGSGFIRYWVDPRGGGRQPIEVEAGFDPNTSEVAQHVSELEMRTVMQPQVDPETGQPLTDELGLPLPPMPVQQPWPDHRPMFVRQDGTLTDDEDDELLALQWTPKIKSEVVTARAVRPIPHTADDVWAADGVQIGTWPTWGEIKRQYPELAELPKEDRQKFFNYRPDRNKELFPDVRTDVDPKNEDERRVWVLFTYYSESEADGYPDGLELVTIADQYVMHREGWEFLLPISQIAQWKEGRESFYKIGTMEFIGGPNEGRAAQMAALLDHLEKFNNAHIFLPPHSIMEPQDRQLPRGSFIFVNPGGEPRFEPVPPYPDSSLQAYAMLGQEMDDALASVGQDLQSPEVESGRHAFAIIGQRIAGLSEPKQFADRAYIRCCRIEAELAQAFIDTPQTNWVSENGQYKEIRWTGEDIVTTTNISIKPGTFTMFSPAGKAQFTDYLYRTMGLITRLQAQELFTTNAGGFIGLQDDPFRVRVRRQIAEWEEGPPEGWTPLPPVPQEVQQIDPATGQPVVGVQMVPQPDPVVLRIFDPLPGDEYPEAVPIRLYELARYMAGVRFKRYPPEWRQLIMNEYIRMAQLVPPPAPPPGAEGTGPENPVQASPEQSLEGAA